MSSSLSPKLREDDKHVWWVDWTNDPTALAYDVIMPDGSHSKVAQNSATKRLGRLTWPFTPPKVAAAYAIDYETAPDPYAKPTPPPSETLVWEGSKLADWGKDNLGGWWNSGKWITNDTVEGIEAILTTPSEPTSGIRGFRFDTRNFRDLIFEQKLFYPVQYKQTANPNTGQFWNIFQFKSRNATRNDPVWAVYVEETAEGLRCKLGWGWGGTVCAGPDRDDPVSGKWFQQRAAIIPIGEWFTIRARLYQSSGFDGRLTVWQNDVLLWDMIDVRTGYDPSGTQWDFNDWNCSNEWAVCHYSDGLAPNPAKVLFGRARILKP